MGYGGSCDTTFDKGRCIPRKCDEKCLFSHICSDRNMCTPKPCNNRNDCYPSESCEIVSGLSQKRCIPNRCKRNSGIETLIRIV